ncbi:MAG: maltose acetyltransferase, partial [Treponema sp.]
AGLTSGAGTCAGAGTCVLQEFPERAVLAGKRSIAQRDVDAR